MTVPHYWGAAPFEIPVNASQGTRPLNEESACASTQGPDCAIPSSWEAAPTHPNRPPGIAYGCEAYAGSCVLVTWTRGISATVDALAGSRPAQCPELNTDGGLLPPRREQVVKGITLCDESTGEVLLPLLQVGKGPARADVAKSTSSNECVSWSRKDDTRHDVTGQMYDTNHGVLRKLPISH